MLNSFCPIAPVASAGFVESGPLVLATVTGNAAAARAAGAAGAVAARSKHGGRAVELPPTVWEALEWACKNKAIKAQIGYFRASNGLEFKSSPKAELVAAMLASCGVHFDGGSTYTHRDNPDHNRFEQLRAEHAANKQVALAAAAEQHTAQLQFAIRTATLLDGKLTAVRNVDSSRNVELADVHAAGAR